MPFWITALIFVGLTVVGELLRPKPKFKDAQPSSLGDFNLPTTSEGRTIPVVFGTCHVKGPNVLWAGDFAVSKVTDKIKTGLFSSKRVVTGYRYYFGAQYGVCMGPVDALVAMRFDDKPLPTGAIFVPPNAPGIEFYHPTSGTTYTANLVDPMGNGEGFASPDLLAQRVEQQMQAAHAGYWKVTFGTWVVSGRTDTLVYNLKISGGPSSNVTVTVEPGVYRDYYALVTALEKALQVAEAGAGGRGTWNVTVDNDTRLLKLTFTSSFPGYEGFYLRGLDNVLGGGGFNIANTILSTLGFPMANDVYFPSVATATYMMATDRMRLDAAEPAGATTNDAAGFTARRILGFDTNNTARPFPLIADFPLWHLGVNYQPYDHGTIIDVVLPTMFGGEDSEGGIVGRFRFYNGDTTQDADPYLARLLGDVPGYRRLAYCVQEQTYIGTQPWPKPISFEVRRCPNGLGLTGGHENIDGDANPAAVIYDVLTNTEWGLGIPAAQIDLPSFQAYGDVLYTEGLGVSMQLDASTSAADFILEVLRHVEGITYIDAVTGKLKLILARPDYVVGNLVQIDKNNATEVVMARASWEETRNVVRVRYVDRTNGYIERIAQEQDNASIQARDGEIAAEEIGFRGLSNPTNAQRLAARALKTLSFPVAQFEITVNRALWSLRPGQVFRLTWEPLGITDLTCRITNIDLGTIEDGKITLQAVEDIFGVPWTSYTPPTSPDWTDPATFPPELIAAAILEAPYVYLASSDIYILAVGVRDPNGITRGFEVWSDPWGGTNFLLTEIVTTTTPSGVTLANISPAASLITIADGPDLNRLTDAAAGELQDGRNVLLIDDEFIAWEWAMRQADGSWVLGGCIRGCADSVPKAHTAGARVYFVSDGMGLARPQGYTDGLTIQARLLAYNTRGVITLGEADILSLAITSRASRPYSPTLLTLNAVSYPANVSGTLVIAWEHRNRLVDYDWANAGLASAAEAGINYRVKIYGEAGTLIRTYDNIAASVKTQTYPLATEISDSGLGRPNERLRVVVESFFTSGGLVCHQPIDYTTDAAGYGMLYGDYYGGAAG